MSVTDIIKQIATMDQKREAIDTIYSAEISVPASGRDIREVLQTVRHELKKNLYIDNAINLLSKGKPRSIAYKKILPANILMLLKSGEQRQVMAGDIFKDYIPLNRIIQKAENMLNSALTEPTLMYVIVSVMSYFTVSIFVKNFSKVPRIDISIVASIKTYYWFITALPMLSVHFLIKKFPDKVPIWNRVYKYIRAANYLLIVKTLADNGMSSADAITFFKKLDDKKLTAHIEQLKPHEKNIEGLTKVLSPYLLPIERALLKTSIKFGEQPRILTQIVQRRIDSIGDVVTSTTGTLNKLLTTLTLIPVSLTIASLLLVTQAMMKLI